MNDLTSTQVESAEGKKIIIRALIVNERGQFLAMLRANGQTNGGTWGIPGGEKKDGESHAAAVWSQVKRATNLIAPKISPTMITKTDECLFHDHVALVRKAKISLNEEHTDCRWVASLDDWPQPAHPVTAQLIQGRRQEIETFIMRYSNQPKQKL